MIPRIHRDNYPVSQVERHPSSASAGSGTYTTNRCVVLYRCRLVCICATATVHIGFYSACMCVPLSDILKVINY